jgi:tetratricopeptide (TPR) repeat protein
MIAHNFIDSDLQVFGTGIAFFALLGVGLLAAIDGVTPEFFPRSFRSVASASIGAVILLFAFVLQIDFGKSRVRGAIAINDSASASSQIEALAGRGAYDHEVAALVADVSSNQDDLLRNLKRATELGPSMRNYRRLARFYMQSGDYPQAVTALQNALKRDPNNLLALRQLMELHVQQEAFTEAEEVAKRLVDVEKSPYYTVRAIPEAVPTETFRARIFLAGRTADASERAELLEGAVRGFVMYAERTIPKVVQMGKVTPPMKFAGEGVDEARDALSQAQKAVAELKNVANASKNPEIQSELERAAMAFEAGDAALASLSR